MDINTLIRIHEISRGVKTSSLESFSSDDVKKDMVDLIEGIKEVETRNASEIKNIDNYTGFIEEGDVVLYYESGKKIFSRLDLSIGVESGLLAFWDDGLGVGSHKLTFDYRGGRDDRFNFEGDENNPVNKIKYSTLDDIIISNPKRNISHLFGEFEPNEGCMGSWKFFEKEKNEGTFFLANHKKQFYLTLNYGGIFGSKNISELNLIQKNLQNFYSFDTVMDFFKNKKVSVARMKGKQLEPGSKFSDIFDGKIKYA